MSSVVHMLTYVHHVSRMSTTGTSTTTATSSSAFHPSSPQRSQTLSLIPSHHSSSSAAARHVRLGFLFREILAIMLGMSGLGTHFYFVKSQPRARHVWLGSSGQVITSFHFAKSKPRVLIVTKKNCVVHVKNIFLRLYFYYICSFFCLLLSL